MNSFFQSANNHIKGLKTKLAESIGTFKKSTEDFIGDIVIKSAVEKLKKGAINMVDSVGVPQNHEEKEGSHAQMANLFSQGSNHSVENILHGHLKACGNEIVTQWRKNLKEQIETFDPEEASSFVLSQFMSGGAENPKFNIDACLQYIGLILAVIGPMLVVAATIGQNKAPEHNAVPPAANNGLGAANDGASEESASANEEPAEGARMGM